MEKRIFNTDLTSMIGEKPIEVDAVDNFNANEYIPTPQSIADKDAEKEKRDKEKEEESKLIDLDDELDESDEEEDVIDEDDNDEDDEDKDKEDQPSQKINKKQSSSPLIPYAKLLKDEGILPNLDLKEFDGTSEGLKEAMFNEIMGAVEYYKDQLPDRIKTIINNYEEGVPLEKLIESDREEVEISKISDDDLKDDIKIQKNILRSYLKKTTKFSDNKIDKQIQFLEDSGDLEDEAISAKDELKSIIDSEKTKAVEEAKARKIEDQKRVQRELKSLEDKIKATDEIIPGVKLNTKSKDNLYKSLTTPAGVDKSGNPVNKIVAARMEDPMGFEIKLHYLFDITKGFTDFSKLSDKGKKDAMKEFEDVVAGLDKNENHSIRSDSRPKVSDSLMRAIGKQFNI